MEKGFAYSGHDCLEADQKPYFVWIIFFVAESVEVSTL